MTASLLAGCGSSSESADSSAASESEKSTETTAEADSTDSTASDGDTMTIEIFDVAANYQGVQTGWFAKVVKDRFNIELNIIAPQVAGDAIYQTRLKNVLMPD